MFWTKYLCLALILYQAHCSVLVLARYICGNYNVSAIEALHGHVSAAMTQAEATSSLSSCNKQMDFKVTLKGKALVSHTFQTLPAIDDLNCQTKCFVDDRCISYSFNERTRLCNLSDSDHIMHPEHLVDKPNAIYRSAENTCDCKVKNMTCRFNFVDNTHRCECKPGFTGAHCEMVWSTITTTPICIGVKNDNYGKIFIPRDCTLIRFKLIYTSGVGVSHYYPQKEPYKWGASGVFQIHITNNKNERISPPTTYNLTSPNLLGYQLDGATVSDPELTFPAIYPPLSAKEGDEYRAWFGQDLMDYHELNNHGKTCAHVMIQTLV